MLLEFDQPAAAFVALLLVALYSFSQISVLKIEVDECQRRRPRIADVFALLLFYFLIMFLRSLTIDRMMFRYDVEQSELATALAFGGTILVVFLLCRIARARHIFYEVDPEVQFSRSQRLLQLIFTVLAVVMMCVDFSLHFQHPPVKAGFDQYLRWFVLPRIFLLVLWLGLSFSLPVHGGNGMFAIRSYGIAFYFALWFVQPSMPSILFLGALLGVLAHELSVFGATPIYGGYTSYRAPGSPVLQYQYNCPYDTAVKK